MGQSYGNAGPLVDYNAATMPLVCTNEITISMLILPQSGSDICSLHVLCLALHLASTNN